jgi:phosphoribosylanthranilate isomerase
MGIDIKICGLSTPETVMAALNAKAKYIGFVFYPASPRNISITQAAILCDLVDKRAYKVGVFVNPQVELLTNVLKLVTLDIIQLHGNESPERVQYIQKRFNIKVMKAIAVASIGDISRAREYETTADMILFDAKATDNIENALPGGNGLQFDWTLISANEWKVPWMLSGGLNAQNVVDAIKISGATMVDVSSGVETSPGLKDVKKIEAFIETAQGSKNE